MHKVNRNEQTPIQHKLTLFGVTGAVAAVVELCTLFALDDDDDDDDDNDDDAEVEDKKAGFFERFESRFSFALSIQQKQC